MSTFTRGFASTPARLLPGTCIACLDILIFLRRRTNRQNLICVDFLVSHDTVLRVTAVFFPAQPLLQRSLSSRSGFWTVARVWRLCMSARRWKPYLEATAICTHISPAICPAGRSHRFLVPFPINQASALTSRASVSFRTVTNFSRRRLFIYLTLSNPKRGPPEQTSASALDPLLGKAPKVFSAAVSVKVACLYRRGIRTPPWQPSVYSLSFTGSVPRAHPPNWSGSSNCHLNCQSGIRSGCRKQSQ